MLQGQCSVFTLQGKLGLAV